MTAFRQRMLGLSARWARAFVGLSDVHAVKKLIDEMARSILTELSSGFVEAITDPDWLATVRDDDEEPKCRRSKATTVPARISSGPVAIGN